MKTYSVLVPILVSLFSSASLLSMRAAEVLTPCFLKVSLYEDIAGDLVDDLVLAGDYPDNPSEVRYLTSFNTRDAFPDNSLDNYGTRIEGFITPQVSGRYYFFLRSDDGAELYLSTDESENNTRLIAEETDCCDPFQDPETDDLATSLPIQLQAGDSYFIMVLHKEGTGGDFAQVAWRLEGDETAAGDLQPISGSFLSTRADDSHNPSISIVQQPADSTGTENGSVTFEVDFDSIPLSPVCVQWQKNGQNIPNAIGNPITLDLLSLSDDGAKIRAVISTPGISVTSQEATLTVTPDTTAPELISASNTPSQPEVILTFSERMAGGSATRTSNYQISSSTGALDVNEAQLSADGTQVILTTADPEIGTEYTLELNNLTDRAAAANPLPDGTTASFFGVGKLLQGSDGFVVWEAEDYDRNLDERWIEVKTREGASNEIAMLIPNGAGGGESDTKLEYDIVFTRTGTHIIWYRAGADSGSDDSAWLHIDGERPPNRTNANQASMSGFNGSVWEWNSNPQDGSPPMTFEIDEVGVHTIGLARREDGAFFDKFVITVDPNFDPDTFGDTGPGLTLREGEPIPAGAAAEITTQPTDTTGTENESITVEAGVSIPEGKLGSIQWQRQDGAGFVDLAGQTLPSLTIDPLTMDWNDAVVRLAVSVSGIETISDPAKISVIPETIVPEVLSAESVASSGRVTLQFSETLDEASATDPDNYQITSGARSVAVTGATLLPNGVTVLLDAGPQTVGNKYTVAVNGVTDTAATPNVIADGVVRYYSLGDLLPQSDDGLLVFEAENFTGNPDELWMEDRSRGRPSGGVSMVNPNGAGGNESSTRLEYDLEFTQTGTHIIWYRASSEGGTDDSAWLHINGERPPSRVDSNEASMTGFSGQADFIWVSDPQTGPSPMTFEIDSPGVYTIGVARREDGAFFDKFVITTDPGFDPRAFGAFGPPTTRSGAPPLPTMTLTSPRDGEELAAGESIQLSVEIGPTTRVVSKVQYFDNEQLIGEATEAPFDLFWESVPDGAYSIRGLLIDDVGATVGTEVHSVLVGEPNDALFVVGNPDLDAAPGDQAAVERLEALGYRVIPVDDNTSQTRNAFGRQLVVISSTVNSGTVTTKFRDVQVPVVIWEQANQDDFNMTTNEDGVTRGGTDADQTTLDIVASGFGGELTGDQPAGELVVADQPTSFNWGQPNENAIVGATLLGNPDRATLYGYEEGDDMIDGFIAPARRVMLFLNDDGLTALNEAGKRLFDTAVAWAVNVEPVSPPPTPPTQPAGDIRVQVARSGGGQITLSWEGGSGPFTLQTKTSLSDADWTDLVTTGDRSATIDTTDGNTFFRVATQ